MPSAVDEARKLLEGELKTLDGEQSVLDKRRGEAEGALKALGGPRRRPGRPRGSKATKAASKNGSGRRRRRGTTRADQAVKLVEKKPGISAAEMAKQMKIKPNYLYRVLGDLEKEGRVKKDGRTYHPAG